jgi:hypothetical protein
MDDARTNPKWFAEILTAHASGAIPGDALEESRREYIALYGEVAGQALFNQEYECSFASVIPGAYYTLELTNAEREGRVTQVDIRCDCLGMLSDTARPIAHRGLLRSQRTRSCALLRVAQ